MAAVFLPPVDTGHETAAPWLPKGVLQELSGNIDTLGKASARHDGPCLTFSVWELARKGRSPRGGSLEKLQAIRQVNGDFRGKIPPRAPWLQLMSRENALNSGRGWKARLRLRHDARADYHPTEQIFARQRIVDVDGPCVASRELAGQSKMNQLRYSTS